MKSLKRLSVVVAIIALITFCFTASAEIVEITSPINYQTIVDPKGNVRINFRVNATVLHNLPHKIILFINGIPQKEIPYNSSRYFLISGVPDGTYEVMIGVYGIDKKPMHFSPNRRFNVSSKPLIVTGI